MPKHHLEVREEQQVIRSTARSPTEEPVLSLGEVLDFMRLIWAMDHGLARTSKHMEATCGLTGPQRLVLRIVGRFPSISAGRLAQILLVHPSTLTGVLQRLEGEGVIRRRADPRDRRRSLVGLTALGRRLDVEAEGTVESAVRSLRSQELCLTAPAGFDPGHPDGEPLLLHLRSQRALTLSLTRTLQGRFVRMHADGSALDRLSALAT